MKEALAKIKKQIQRGGIPQACLPLTFAVIGSGRVSQGVLEVLEQFPHKMVPPSELPTFVEEERKKPRKDHQIVISCFCAQDLVRPKDKSAVFDKKHYYENPHLYESKFSENLPYVNFLITGMYWEQKFPRLLTEEELK
jgi:alpha-aminoadipic semialdehyde synthase